MKYIDDLFPDIDDVFNVPTRSFWREEVVVITISIVLIVGVAVAIFLAITSGHAESNHYNADFKVFCKQLHGKAIIDDRNLCLSSDKRVLMYESNGDNVDPANHYNDDFARYCEARGGYATVGIEHDICVRDGVLIMREGKY